VFSRGPLLTATSMGCDWQLLAVDAQSHLERSEQSLRELRADNAMARAREEEAGAMLKRAEGEKRELLDALRCAQAGACPSSTPVSGYSGSPIWWARALSLSRVDGFAPRTQHVNLRIVRRPAHVRQS
jgi:hypothetical protein